MSTHQLPYQLVSQRDTLQQHRSQGQQNPTHIAQLLGRTTQVNNKDKVELRYLLLTCLDTL